MFLTSQERKTMTSRSSSDSERQNLLDRLLDAVKQCQVRFGGRTELATDTDSRVTCLLAQLLAVFNHGLKKPKGTVRAFMQVGQVAGLTKQEELEPAFYNFIKEHLSKNEQERFVGLHNITTDAGRGAILFILMGYLCTTTTGRAWLRSTLNEHTLEKCIHSILGDKKLLSLYYEPDAFLLDEEKASMLPMIAAGLSSILFALGIDKEELNTVKQASPQLPSTKEVFSNLLSSFPAVKPKPEPVAVVAETTQQDDAKKKKKKKIKSAAIALIDDGDSSTWGSTGELELNISDPNLQDSKDFPFTDASIYLSKEPKKSTKQGHSRSSSYPGKIKLETNENSDQLLGTSLPKSSASGFGSGQQGVLREISLSDTSLTEESRSDVKWTNNPEDDQCERVMKPYLVKTSSFGQLVDTIEEKDEHQNEEFKGSPSPGVHGYSVTIGTDKRMDVDCGSNVKYSTVLPGNSHKETKNFNSSVIQGLSHDKINKEGMFSIKSFKSSKPEQITKQNDNEKRQSLEETDLSGQDILSSSVSRVDGSLLFMGGDDGLTPLSEHKTVKNQDSLPLGKMAVLGGQETVEDKEDQDSSKDSVSLSSNSWFEDNDDRDQSEDDFLRRVMSESLSAATDAAAAALELCAPSKADHLSSISSNGRQNTTSANVLTAQQEGMTTSELKQAIVSMMLRKDEIEDQNRVLRQLLEEKRHDKEVMEAEMELIKQEHKTREEQDASQITALTRENEVLKHQLKKYVGAVQMLRSSMNDKNSTINLQGIRQDEVLPALPEKRTDQNMDSENVANEYEQKLIQVAEMHGELMEFNERLQRQLNYWKIKSQRQQEELVSLRGPLPEDSSVSDSSGLSNTDVNVVNNRPLINVWIPSVFLKGKGSTGVHHLYQVYIRIKDDEWNVYRRYSQFYELHKKICKKHKITESFKFPSKKTFGNRGIKFVEERRKVLQEYIRHVVNLIISTQPELASNTCKATLLDVMPFFGDPYPQEKTSSRQRKNTEPYDGL